MEIYEEAKPVEVHERAGNKSRRSWSQLKSIVEFSRRMPYAISADVPSQITFRKIFNEYGQMENRIYFLAGSARSDPTIKYLNVIPGQQIEMANAQPLFTEINLSSEKSELTKEEQLLRERKRCSFNGITSYHMNDGRFVFSLNSELYFMDDDVKNSRLPNQIATCLKGAIDIKSCPYDSSIVSYIINGDLWVNNLRTGQEIRLTESSEFCTSGAPSYIIQEEFDRYTGYWWQPKNDSVNSANLVYRIIYEVVDDSCVDLTYITPSCVNEFGYDTYRYPKAGTTNSKIHLKMVEFSFPDEKIVTKSMAHEFRELFSWYEYMVRGEWTPNGDHFWVQILDRLQLRSANLLIPIEFFQEKSDSNFDANVYLINEQTTDIWINTNNLMYMLKQDDRSALSFINANEETGFLHLYHYQISLQRQNFVKLSKGVLKSISQVKTQLTSGDWPVQRDNISVDQQNGLVYFMAFKNPLESHLFVVSIHDPLKIKQLTANGFSHSVTINEDCTVFVDICSSVSTAHKSFVYQIINQKLGVDKLNASAIAQISCSTDELRLNETPMPIEFSALATSDSTSPQIFSFETSDNCLLYGMIFLPNNYVVGQKYPTVLYVYGGPHVQLVSNSYKSNKFLKLHTLALLGYCVVIIDSRGSDNRGLHFESHIKHKMGQVEIQDQVEGLQWAANNFKCIDMSRVAIFGWSYGGYMSLMGLVQRPDVFKVAVSGAPVTTWSLYDTGYTERYMGLPQSNEVAYAQGSVITRARSFPNEENRLLIIHGLIDENVHFAHTRQLIDALIKECKPYSLQVYPKERHGMRSLEASIHCDLNFFSFLEQHL